MLNSLFVNVTSPTTRNVGMVKEALKKQENINKFLLMPMGVCARKTLRSTPHRH